MNIPHHRRLVTLCCAILLFILAGCGSHPSGPWNLADLKKPPRVEWIDTSGPVRSLYYAGEPYGGRPTRVFAYYAVPATSGEKVPAMVLVHGGGGTAFREWVELWAARGYAAIAMDLAGNGPDKKRLPDGGPAQGHQQQFVDIAKGVDQTWPYHAVANVLRAHSLLRAQPEVDAARTGITGISWGGYLTCITAGLDDRFKVAVPVYGCGYLYENSKWLDAFGQFPADQKALWIENFDPSRYLPGCRIPILFVNGTNDFAYPLDSYQKSYRAVKGPRTLCIKVGMQHSHPHGWAPKEIGIFVDSVLRKGQPLPRIQSASRTGKVVTAEFQTTVPVVEAALHYTTVEGPWTERKWRSAAACLVGNRVTAELPDTEGIVYFLTITDERGATVSTEHEVIASDDKKG